MTFKSIGIARHRIGRDGVGVTTLVGGAGCPLDCKYCLNPQCKRHAPYEYTVEALYDLLAVDSLYFEATGGGVVFGGGEPLLQAEFIREFILYTRQRNANWRFTLETSLAVSLDRLMLLDGLIDEYIVDIKDMNDGIYFAYTGKSADDMKRALTHLASIPERVTVRVPLIPEYNTESDTERSIAVLLKLGFSHFDEFTYVMDAYRKKQ